MHGLRHFYHKIQHTTHTSFKKHVDILPPFRKLTMIPNITRLFVQNNTDYVGYTTIKSIYNWFSDSITNILFDNNVINNKCTPYKNFTQNKQHYGLDHTEATSPTISALEQMERLLHSNVIAYITDTTDDDNSKSTEEDGNMIPSKYIPIIAAFQHSNNIICDACG